MTEKPILSAQDVIRGLSNYYNIEVDTLTLLDTSAGCKTSVYKAKTQDHSYFVKVIHRHDGISLAIIELLQHAGIEEVLSPLKTSQGKTSQSWDEFTLIVFPFVEGEDGFTCPLRDDQWIRLGQIIRKIHEIEIPHHLQDKIRREKYSNKWREAVRALYVDISLQIELPVELQVINHDEISLKLLKFMKENAETIHRLVERAQTLSQKIKNQASDPKFVLCHGDLHAGNIIISGKEKFYIVDWDVPVMAPKERDLMFLGGGVGNVWNKPSEEKLFYHGYGAIEINTTLLAYYRCERIVEDIALFGQALLLTTTAEEDRLLMYKRFINMFAAGGVVEIAFETREKI